MELGVVFLGQPLGQRVGGHFLGEEDREREGVLVFRHGEEGYPFGDHAHFKLRLDAKCLHNLPHAVSTEVDEN